MAILARNLPETQDGAAPERGERVAPAPVWGVPVGVTEVSLSGSNTAWS